MHILNNSSSCIDLTFNSQPNLPIESGIHPSLQPNCHHQIIFAKFNLDIAYQPPYEREIWYYQKVNVGLIKRAINSFDWEKAFSKIDADKMFSIFNQGNQGNWTRKSKNWFIKRKIFSIVSFEVITTSSH